MTAFFFNKKLCFESKKYDWNEAYVWVNSLYTTNLQISLDFFFFFLKVCHEDRLVGHKDWL